MVNTLALPALFSGCETWVIRGRDKSGITSAQIKFTRRSENTHSRITKPLKAVYQKLKLTQMQRKFKLKKTMDTTCSANGQTVWHVQL
jgi:hypothetical protein